MKEFRKIPSLKFLYEVNCYGVIRNVKSKHICSPYKSNNGYLRIAIRNSSLLGSYKKNLHVLISRIVAECWCEVPDHLKHFGISELQVNHIDGNKENNYFKNLEWCLNYENMIHAFDNGLQKEADEWIKKKYPKKPIRCIDNGLEFESSYQAAEWLIKENQYKKRRTTVAQSLRECARGLKKTAYGYKWEYI